MKSQMSKSNESSWIGLKKGDAVFRFNPLLQQIESAKITDVVEDAYALFQTPEGIGTINFKENTEWQRTEPKWAPVYWHLRKHLNGLANLGLTLLGIFLSAISNGMGLAIGFYLIWKWVIK